MGQDDLFGGRLAPIHASRPLFFVGVLDFHVDRVNLVGANRQADGGRKRDFFLGKTLFEHVERLLLPLVEDPPFGLDVEVAGGRTPFLLCLLQHLQLGAAVEGADFVVVLLGLLLLLLALRQLLGEIGLSKCLFWK